MIYLVTAKAPKAAWFKTATLSKEPIELATVNDVGDWLYDSNRKVIGFDTETTGLDPHTSVIQTVQIGDDRDQFFLDDTVDWDFLNEALEDEDLIKILHNAAYDYKMWRAYLNNYKFKPYHIKNRWIMRNIYDTMLGEMILTTGLEREEQIGKLGLVDVAYKYTGAVLRKEYRMERDTPDAIYYGVSDISPLPDIREQQLSVISSLDLGNTLVLENNAILSIADMEFNGIRVDAKKWLDVATTVEANVISQIHILDEIVATSGIAATIRGERLNSRTKLAEVKARNIVPQDVQLGFDFGASDPIHNIANAIDKFSGRPNGKKKSTSTTKVVQLGFNPDDNRTIISRNKVLSEHFETQEVKKKKKKLLDAIIARTLRRTKINWNSHIQKKKMLSKIGIHLTSTKKQYMIKHRNKHKLVSELMIYSDQAKLASSFGRNFIPDFLHKDTERVHPSFWPIVSTGRVSQSKPNLLQIPQKGIEGPLIRSAFIASPGNKIVGGDYSGMELRIIAEFSQDPFWIEVFNRGGDLHSELAAMTFGIPLEKIKWQELNAKGELVDKELAAHFQPTKSYRYIQKSINFGLAYGMSEYKLADDIDIFPNFKALTEDPLVMIEMSKEAKSLGYKGDSTTVEKLFYEKKIFTHTTTADMIIDKYFSLVPKVKVFLDGLGQLGVQRGFIRTAAPYKRMRVFPQWSRDMNFATRGEIERASKNMPIQGTNGDIIKAALITMRNEIIQTGASVVMLNSIYDEIIVECKEEFASEWKVKQDRIMKDAAMVQIKSVPIKVDCKISDHWQK